MWADQTLIALDQDGTLMIAPDPARSFPWTPPALVGSRLYIGDRRSMMAGDPG